MNLFYRNVGNGKAIFTFSFLLVCHFLFAGHSPKEYIIYYGKNGTATERAVCQDLKDDLQRVTGGKVLVLPEPVAIPRSGNYYVVGTRTSVKLLDQWIGKGAIPWNAGGMGEQGGMIHSLQIGAARIIILAGITPEGGQNAVYEYAKTTLGIDPLQYWTGYKPKTNSQLDTCTVAHRIIPSPAVPIICYFENDVDELANMTKPYLEYDMATWKGMVNSLRRMRYNAIQLFDMLGRAEFFTREPYKQLRPGYRTNLSLVDSLIDYAHLKGIQIQVDLSPGYQVRAITDSEALCWTRYKQKWIDTWVYYLTETPLGKADIFSLRPRNQVWDRAYVSSCGESKEQVFNEVFAALDSVLRVYKPQARKLCICYDDGMEMFNAGFKPPEDFVVVWSDDGYCDFKTLPTSTKGYDFGTYMHAGFWKNHTVHDPYPEKVDSVLSFMLDRYNARSYLEVNGQTFRPFLINLDAFAQWAVDPGHFDGKTFLKDWCGYYFDAAAVPYAIASMNALHQAQFGRNGYVQNLSEIKRILSFLSLDDWKEKKPATRKNGILFPELELRRSFLETALTEASAGLSKSIQRYGFYYDYIYLPALMYHQLLEFEGVLLDVARLKEAYTENGQKQDDLAKAKRLMTKASVQLKAIYRTCEEGDRNPKWKTWYDPAKRRPNNGFPAPGMIKAIQKKLDELTTK